MPKSNVKKMMKLLSLKKLQKKIMFLLKPKNLRNVLILLAVLALLYVIRQNFLAKEGFESTPDEFEQKISGQNALVLFHAEWCGHCKKFMPEWNKISEEVNAIENANVILLKVECGDPKTDQTHGDIMSKYGVKGYPTLISFDESGKHSEYNGDRSKSGILSFLGIDGSVGKEGMNNAKKKNKKKIVKPKHGDNFESKMNLEDSLETILERSKI